MTGATTATGAGAGIDRSVGGRAATRARPPAGTAGEAGGRRDPEPFPLAAFADDPEEAAKAAGLRYVSDHAPGLRRKRAGKGWSFLGLNGKPIRDKRELTRIKALGIPPAYTDVWISPDPRGHIQATGRDAKGRKQYRYHARWREVRDETKYTRLIAFGEALPAIRARVDADLRRHGMPREKVLATVVRLLETTLIRVGNDEYARTNESYGLTTMHDEHVDVHGATVRFAFRGKSGKEHHIDVRDPRLARIVKRSQDLPGQELFQYVDEAGETHDIGSADVNDYLREVTGQEFTAKDFRTWAGTVLAAHALRDLEAGETQTALKQNVVRAIEQVAARLGNTRAVCRKSYVHPAVIDAYLDGSLLATLRQRADVELAERGADLTADEVAVLAFLRARLAAGETDSRS